MASNPTVAGSAYFTLDTGKRVGPYAAVYSPGDNFLDVTKGGAGYPTRLDFNKFHKVKEIGFEPYLGKHRRWSSWTYFNHAQWRDDRFTNLA